MLQVDLSAVDPRVVQELVQGRHAKDALTLQRAPENQLRLAQENQGDWRSLDGPGAPTLSITPEAYHYWGQRFSYDAQGNYIGDGYACWRDKQFLAEFKRDNPECRISAKGTRVQVGSAGDVKSPAAITSQGTRMEDGGLRMELKSPAAITSRGDVKVPVALTSQGAGESKTRFRKSYG